MGQGKDEEWITDQCRRSNRPLPKGIEDAPELLAGLDLYWVAYADLTTCRPASYGGASPIPWSAMAEYAAVQEFDEEQRQSLFYFARKMDAAFMEWFEKKHGHKQKSRSIGQEAKRGG